MAGDIDLPLPCSFGLKLQTQRLQQVFNFTVSQLQTVHAVDLRGTQLDLCRLGHGLAIAGINYRPGLAADNLQQQLSGTLHGTFGQLPVHAPLKTV